MVQKEFIKRYRNAEFEIELIVSGDIWETMVWADGKLLKGIEEEYFWDLYSSMDIVEDIDKEIVKFKK